MFERNRVDRPQDVERSAEEVEITLEDGRTLHGRLFRPAARPLSDELNSANGFLDFEVFDGERLFLSKQSIQAVRLKLVPRGDQLVRAQNQADHFDPRAVLRVPETASKDDIRHAYHELVKQYHPDRFSNIDLPREVRDYLNAMSRRITAAYTTLVSTPRRDSVTAAGQ